MIRRISFVPYTECRRERLEAERRRGAEAVCIPLPRTRLPIQSAIDEALRLGIPVYGLIAPESSGEPVDAERIRRLVEGYPNMDGYYVAGASPDALDAACALLSGYAIEAIPESEILT